FVGEGGIVIFPVALEKGEPVGTRTHFLGIVSGQVFFGFDLRRYNVGSGFLAVAKQGTKLRKLSLARMQQLAADPVQSAAIAPLVDAWVTGLSTALVVSIQPNQRGGGQLLKAGQRVELSKGTRAAAEEGVLWLNISSGSVVFDDLETPTLKRRNTFFPFSARACIRRVSDKLGPRSITRAATTTVAGMPLFWHGLDVFHEVLCKS